MLATAALYTRQPLLVAYIAVGCILGPHGFKMVSDAELLSEIAEIGIIFLLFLLGLILGLIGVYYFFVRGDDSEIA